MAALPLAGGVAAIADVPVRLGLAAPGPAAGGPGGGPADAGRAAVLGLCLGLMLLAGHLQIALYCLGFTAAYALFRVMPRWRTQWRPLVGCAAAGPRPGVRPGRAAAAARRGTGPDVAPRGRIADLGAYQSYVRLALPPANLVTLFAPGFYGNPTRGTYWGIGLNGGPGAYMENACYVGILPLLLAPGRTVPDLAACPARASSPLPPWLRSCWPWGRR